MSMKIEYRIVKRSGLRDDVSILMKIEPENRLSDWLDQSKINHRTVPWQSIHYLVPEQLIHVHLNLFWPFAACIRDQMGRLASVCRVKALHDKWHIFLACQMHDRWWKGGLAYACGNRDQLQPAHGGSAQCTTQPHKPPTSTNRFAEILNTYTLIYIYIYIQDTTGGRVNIYLHVTTSFL